MSNNIDSATYSTSEKAIGTWIDGNTIYRKTISFSSVSPGGRQILDLGLAGGETFGTIVKVYGAIHDSSYNWQIIPRPLATASQWEISVGDFGSSDIGGSGHFGMNIGNGYSSNDYGYITVEYTKS